MSLALLCVVVCRSQSRNTYITAEQNAHHSFIVQLLNRPVAMAAKTSITQERLIGSRFNWNQFKPSNNIYDSSRYVYSGSNGSQFDLNALQYNFPATQFDDNMPMLDVHGYHVLQPEIKCDSPRFAVAPENVFIIDSSAAGIAH